MIKVESCQFPVGSCIPNKVRYDYLSKLKIHNIQYIKDKYIYIYITHCTIQLQKCQLGEMTVFLSCGKGHCQWNCGTPAIETLSMHDLALNLASYYTPMFGPLIIGQNQQPINHEPCILQYWQCSGLSWQQGQAMNWVRNPSHQMPLASTQIWSKVFYGIIKGQYELKVKMMLLEQLKW